MATQPQTIPFEKHVLSTRVRMGTVLALQSNGSWLMSQAESPESQRPFSISHRRTLKALSWSLNPHDKTPTQIHRRPDARRDAGAAEPNTGASYHVYGWHRTYAVHVNVHIDHSRLYCGEKYTCVSNVRYSEKRRTKPNVQKLGH